MSIRTLIEINHDYGRDICKPELLGLLQRAINCAGRDEHQALEDGTHGGVRVIATRHHADPFWIREGTDGFPAKSYIARTL